MALDIRTHQKIDPRWSGRVLSLADGEAVVVLSTNADMVADTFGLVHGGFVFSAMDHAAMLAVNEPTTVLGESKVRFLAPVRVGDEVTLHARRLRIEGKKHIVEVEAHTPASRVAHGELICFVPSQHVLQAK